MFRIITIFLGEILAFIIPLIAMKFQFGDFFEWRLFAPSCILMLAIGFYVATLKRFFETSQKFFMASLAVILFPTFSGLMIIALIFMGQPDAQMSITVTIIASLAFICTLALLTGFGIGRLTQR